MSNWRPKHETVWLALGNDANNTLIGIADSYETINAVGGDWSKATGETHYLRQYVEKPEELHEPELPRVIEVNGHLYHRGD